MRIADADGDVPVGGGVGRVGEVGCWRYFLDCFDEVCSSHAVVAAARHHCSDGAHNVGC